MGNCARIPVDQLAADCVRFCDVKPDHNSFRKGQGYPVYCANKDDGQDISERLIYDAGRLHAGGQFLAGPYGADKFIDEPIGFNHFARRIRIRETLRP